MLRHRLGRLLKFGILGCAFSLLAFGCSSTSSSSTEGGGGGSNGGAKSSDIKIALSNSYAGNSWRKQMVSDFTTVAKKAKADGQISSFDVVNSNNDASQQISQLQDMILQGYNAIVIDAASPTALNGVIQKACKAGITVVVFDSLATAPCAYKLESNYVEYGKIQTEYVAKQLNGRGNILEIRGVAGTSVDSDISKGIHDTVAKYPGLKIVGQVHGNWTETIAQQAVVGILPSLPKVDAVVDQGGDGAGAIKAFQAQHKDVPLTIIGNRGAGLQAWNDLLKEDKSYKTMSISSMPGMSTIAFWMAYMKVQGQDVPKTVYAPMLEIQQDHLAAWLKVTPASGVATKTFTLEETKGFVKATASGSPTYVVSDLPAKS